MEAADSMQCTVLGRRIGVVPQRRWTCVHRWDAANLRGGDLWGGLTSQRSERSDHHASARSRSANRTREAPVRVTGSLGVRRWASLAGRCRQGSSRVVARCAWRV